MDGQSVTAAGPADRRPSEGTFGLATVLVEDRPAVAIMTATGLVPLAAVVDDRPAPAGVRDLLGDWDGWCDAIADGLAEREPELLDESRTRFLPPVPDPPTIYCSGANYHDHVTEMGRDAGDETVPFHFLLPPAALIGHRQAVRAPSDPEAKLDWEVELVAVIGRRVERAAPRDALDAVAGYTVANDVSVRDWGPTGRHPIFGHRWIERKGRATFLPLGPAVVPARFVPDPGALDLGLDVDGEVRQRSNTAQMIFSVADQIVHLSGIVPLLPGDLILTGTPAGTAAAHGRYLAAGDRMVAWAAGIGALENPIIEQES